MSEDTDQEDKHYDPTPRKLQQAREKGDVPQSKELHGLALYLGLLASCGIFGPWMVDHIGTHLSLFIRNAHSLVVQENEMSMAYAVADLITEVIIGLSPIIVGIMVAPLLSMIAQNSITFSASKLELKLERISLIQGFKNKFGKNAMVEFLKGNVKIGMIGIGVLIISIPLLEESPAWVGTDSHLLGLILGHIWLKIIIAVTIIAGVIGIFDFLWQRYAFTQKMMMSFKEIKDENKDSEGDPHMKHKRKEKGREIAMNQMLAEVPKADVVVVNPTHYAVALKWEGAKGTAPVCIAKGTDEIALAMKAKAAECKVPVRADAPLARTLFAVVEIGDEIREEHYAAVAAALRFAAQMRKKEKNKAYSE